MFVSTHLNMGFVEYTAWQFVLKQQRNLHTRIFISTLLSKLSIIWFFFLNVTLILRCMVRLYGQWGQMKKNRTPVKKRKKRKPTTNNKKK